MKKIASNIDQLIVKRLLGDIQNQEERILNDWINSSESNSEYMSGMKILWDKSSDLKAFAKIDIESDFEIFRSKAGLSTRKINFNKSRSWLIRAAAVMIPAVMILAAFTLYQTTPGFGKWSALGTSDVTEKIILADNSEVELNKNSKLVYLKSFNKDVRLVKLNVE